MTYANLLLPMIGNTKIRNNLQAKETLNVPFSREKRTAEKERQRLCMHLLYLLDFSLYSESCFERRKV